MKKKSKTPAEASKKILPRDYTDRNEGFNDVYLPYAAGVLRDSGFSEEEAISFLEEQQENCHELDPHRKVQTGEIEHAMDNVFHSERPKKKTGPKWPVYHEGIFNLVMDDAIKQRAKELQEESDEYLSTPLYSKSALSFLYRPDELLTISKPDAEKGHKRPSTKPLKRFTEMELTSRSHVCPNPKTSEADENTWSGHGKGNIGPRRYLVIECDKMPFDRQWELIAWLEDYDLPLAMVVHSGGKSLHAWINVADVPEEHVKQLFTVCCVLGADPAMWKPSQWARMPNGTREIWENGSVVEKHPQPVLWLSNDLIEGKYQGAPTRFKTWLSDAITVKSLQKQFAEGVMLEKNSEPGEKIVSTRNQYWFYLGNEWMEFSAPRAERQVRDQIVKSFEGGEPPSKDIIEALVFDRFVKIDSVHRVDAVLSIPFRPEGVIRQKIGRESKTILNRNPARVMDPFGDHLNWGDWKTDPELTPVRLLLERFNPDEMIHLIDSLRWLIVRGHQGLMGNSLMFVIVGKPDAGKTYLANCLFGKILGGAADAENILVQSKDNFTGDAYSCPVWTLDDSKGTDRGDNIQISKAMKRLVANRKIGIRKMRQDPVEIPWGGSLLMTLNDESECIKDIPNLSIGIKDKLSLLKQHVTKSPFYDPDSPEWERACGRFVRFCLDTTIGDAIPNEVGVWVNPETGMPESYEFTEDRSDRRFGVKAVHNEEILEAYQNESWSPSQDLKEALMYIQSGSNIAKKGSYEWEGTSSALLEDLELVPSFRAFPQKIKTPRGLASVLRTLAEELPKGTITFRYGHGKTRLWTIRSLF